jgi:hypothetical protein
VKKAARSLVAVLLAVALAGAGQAAPGFTIRLNSRADRLSFDVAGLDESNLKTLGTTGWEPGRWELLFAVYVDREPPDGGSQPAVLGSYRIEDGVLRFTPRFPPAPGVRYRAVFEPSRLPQPSDPKAPAVVEQVTVPRPPAAAPTVVEHVYPSANRLPENLLKFYLHFSAPMSRGEAYRHIHLLDAAGKPIESAFLEVGEELWDPEGKRFTLFIDPGRIKQGLKPREDLGPVLEAGKKYSLVLDRDWRDARGDLLAEPYRKPFEAVVAAEQPPDPKSWKVEVPPAGTSRPLEVRFPGPLDRALLGRLVRVTDAGGREVAGAATVSDQETRWQFTPARPWQAGDYRLTAGTELEDLAGNSIARPFEVDVVHPVRPTTARTVTLPFSVHESARP